MIDGFYRFNLKQVLDAAQVHYYNEKQKDFMKIIDRKIQKLCSAKSYERRNSNA